MEGDQRFCSRTCAAPARRPPQACSRCGVTFSPRRSGLKYCSPSCAAEARRKRFPVRCTSCGRTFTPAVKTQRFCSRACVRAVGRESRKCDGCGASFPPLTWSHRFCSRTCARAFKAARRERAAARPCRQCGTPFTPKSSRSVFCSQQCSWARRRARNRRNCAFCGAEFGFLDKRQRFCSKRCGVLGKLQNRADRAPNWKGGRSSSPGTNGYVRIRMPGHPRTTAKNHYVLEHIVVMERVLGRYLLPNERVHHRNGRRDDNRPENLELWKMKDPPGVRAADHHCPGCQCDRSRGDAVEILPDALAESAAHWTRRAA